VRAGLAHLALGAVAVAAGCGTASSGPAALPVSGTDVSCAAGMYILDGGCAELPPFSDASVAFDDGSLDLDGDGAPPPLADDATAADASTQASDGSPLWTD
jgi:hypothetical protein